MTSIGALRKKYGDSPVPLKDFKFGAGGHSFDCYMVKHSRGSMKSKAQLALKDGTSVTVDVDTPTESETRSKRAYFQVDPDKDRLLFFESEQHVSDLLECRRAYEDKQVSINLSHADGLKEIERQLGKAQSDFDARRKRMDKAEAMFDLGYTTDVKYGLLGEAEDKVRGLRGKLNAMASGPAKPDKSFATAIQFHLPVPVKFPDVWVNVANELRAYFIERLGVVPTVPQPITVVGLVRSTVVLRP